MKSWRKEELDELFETYYGGFFARMACNYLHATGMSLLEVEELVEVIRQEMTKNG